MDKKVDVCAELKTRLPDLPRIMRAHNWTRGADLMEEWLNRGYNDNAENDLFPNTRTIKMEWILSYSRVMREYLNFKNSAVWSNKAAQSMIVKVLIEEKDRLPKEVGDKMEIGNLGEDITPRGMLQFHSEWHIQYREVTQTSYAYEYTGEGFENTLDDLYAALGDFNFYYIVKGWVERLPDKDNKPRYQVTINKVGVYARDSYDFKDRSLLASFVMSQVLGFWSCKNNYVGRMTGIDRYPVQNRDFIEWRKRYGNGRGGDFMVFSDIKVFDHYSTFEFSK